MRAPRDSRARPNPLERCYDWCCVVKRLFRKSDAGSAKRSTLHDSSQSLFLTLLLLIQSQDRYGPNAIQDLLSRSWGGILSSNLFFKNIRISDLNCHGTSRRSQRRTIMIQRPECKYFSSFHPVGSCLDPYECRKSHAAWEGPHHNDIHPDGKWKKHIYRLFDIADMNHLTKQSKDSLQKSTWGERKKSKQTLETAHWLPTKRIQHDAPPSNQDSTSQ